MCEVHPYKLVQGIKKNWENDNSQFLNFPIFNELIQQVNLKKAKHDCLATEYLNETPCAPLIDLSKGDFDRTAVVSCVGKFCYLKI